jgi:hypothetical protein
MTRYAQIQAIVHNYRLKLCDRPKGRHCRAQCFLSSRQSLMSPSMFRRLLSISAEPS